MERDDTRGAGRDLQRRTLIAGGGALGLTTLFLPSIASASSGAGANAGTADPGLNSEWTVMIFQVSSENTATPPRVRIDFWGKHESTSNDPATQVRVKFFYRSSPTAPAQFIGEAFQSGDPAIAPGEFVIVTPALDVAPLAGGYIARIYPGTSGTVYTAEGVFDTYSSPPPAWGG